MEFHKNMAIHCPKYEDAVNLLEELEPLGYKWSSGDPLSWMSYVDFYFYGENTYFFIGNDDVMYGDDTYLSGHEVYEFSEGKLTLESAGVCVESKEINALQYALDVLKEYVSSAGYDEEAIEAESVLTELINKLKVDVD